MTSAPRRAAARDRRLSWVTRLASLLRVRLLLAAAVCLVLTIPAVAAEGAMGSLRQVAGATSVSYRYDSPAASTTPPASARSDAARARPSSSSVPRSSMTLTARVLATKAGAELVDVAARRATLRVGTKAEVRGAAPKTAGAISSIRTPAR